MGFLRTMGGPRASADWAPYDDRWYYGSGGTEALSGVRVSPDTAIKLTTWNAGKRLLSNTVAMLPWDVFERLDGGRRQRAEGNPVDILLHDQPNEYQTAFEFKQGVVSDLADYGNAITELIPGPRSSFEVWPIHPEFVCVDWLNRKSSRERVYDVSSAHDGVARVLRASDVWHMRFVSRNGGLTGASPVRLASEGIGMALATQTGMARLLANGLVPQMTYSSDKIVNQDDADKLRTLIKSQLSGPMNWGEPLVLGKGATAAPAGITPKDAMVKDLLDYSVSDIARILGIPLVLLQAESKDTSWGSGIEHLKLAFATFTIGPIVTMLEESADANLITQRRRFFSEFNMNALLRGDLLRRYQAYAIAVNANNPWLKRNDILRTENLDPDTGHDGERYLVPQNNVGSGSHPGTTGVNDQNAMRVIDQLNATVGAIAKDLGIAVEVPPKLTNGHTEAAA